MVLILFYTPQCLLCIQVMLGRASQGVIVLCFSSCFVGLHFPSCLMSCFCNWFQLCLISCLSFFLCCPFVQLSLFFYTLCLLLLPCHVSCLIVDQTLWGFIKDNCTWIRSPVLSSDGQSEALYVLSRLAHVVKIKGMSVCPHRL